MIEAIALDYQPNLTAIVAKLRHLPWLAALDSGSESHPERRYDIVSAEPLLQVTADHSHTRVVSEGETILRTTACPFAVLQSVLDDYRLPEHDSPFAGGLLGYFAYDLAYRLAPIERHIDADIDLPLLAVGLYDWSIVTDHQQQTTTCYWIPAWSDKPKQRQAQIYQYLALLTDAKPEMAEKSTHFALTSDFAANMTQADYGKAISIIKDHLHAGNAYQVNFAQRFSADYEGCPYELYQLLTENQALGPFSAYLQFSGATVISVSPERFLGLQAGVVQTQPIKGTVPRGETAAADLEQQQILLASEKDRAENLMIVDLLRNDLGKCCVPGSIEVEQLFGLESFKTVHHLVSRITGKLAAEQTPLSLLKSAFPGGSITGAPKLSAMQIIEELEPNQRHIYCGSIGYIDGSGKMDTNIAIRTMVAHQGRLHFWGGGGIVVDSTAEAEYQESLDKVASFMELFSGR